MKDSDIHETGKKQGVRLRRTPLTAWTEFAGCGTETRGLGGTIPGAQN